MRCMISPVFFESKKRIGSFSNLKIKSEISATLIRVLICVNIQLCMKPTDNWLVDNINCVTNIRIIKFKLLFNTPTSIIDCVKNGNINWNTSPNSIQTSFCEDEGNLRRIKYSAF